LKHRLSCGKTCRRAPASVYQSWQAFSMSPILTLQKKSTKLGAKRISGEFKWVVDSSFSQYITAILGVTHRARYPASRRVCKLSRTSVDTNCLRPAPIRKAMLGTPQAARRTPTNARGLSAEHSWTSLTAHIRTGRFKATGRTKQTMAPAQMDPVIPRPRTASG
jgi:hypothetical protein